MSDEPLNPNGIAGKPLEPQVSADTPAFKSFEAATAIPTPVPKPDIQDSINLLHKEQDLQHLRTYQSDIADVVRHKDASVVKIAVAQQAKPQPKIVVDPKRSAALLVLSILLMIGSGIAVTIYTVIHTFLKADQAVVSQKETVVISTEKTQNIMLKDSENISDALKKAKIPASSGNTTFLRFKIITGTSTVATGRTVGERLGANVPEALTRTLGDMYSLGIQQKETNVPYIIFKTNSYETAFASMLKWESTMRTDIESAFSEFIASSSLQFQSASFSDTIIKNKSVRVLTASSTPVLFYAFPDRETLVITTNQNTLEEIFNRLGTSQFLR